ncbi:hypothetical protein AGLY_002953 [Aphis glycines]|uniref:Uncharacterized protein n=1 Tax=Aphis glycines TaxID=307491 RepID=A0A6G0U431_APHGL|nr:hypothetical protein AGLY_002953 [Aphis glycines]
MFVCERPGSDAILTSPNSRRRPVQSRRRRALVAAVTDDDDDDDDCCIPDRWRILRGGPGSARRPRHARSIRPGLPTRLCRRYGRTSPSAPSEGRGCTRARMRRLERNVRKDVAGTDGQTDCRSGLIEPSADRGQTAKRLAEGRREEGGRTDTRKRSRRRAQTAFARSLSISRLASAHTRRQPDGQATWARQGIGAYII